MNDEIYLGENLNRARNDASYREATNVNSGKYPLCVILDGRERKNPSAERASGVEDGNYEITRVEGNPPGDVRYWGRRFDGPAED